MVDSEKLIGDVVSSIVEKVLMNIGITTYTKVGEILADHNLTFSDCYEKPEILNFALKELFGNSYLVIVDKIKIELGELEDDNHGLAMFVQKISE